MLISRSMPDWLVDNVPVDASTALLRPSRFDADQAYLSNLAFITQGESEVKFVPFSLP